MAESISQPDPIARLVSAENRAMRGDPTVFTELVELLVSPNSYIRSSAASTLGQLRDPRAIRWLLPLLHDGADIDAGTASGSRRHSERRSVAHGAAYGLYLLGDPAVPALLEATRDSDWRARYWAIDALSRRREARLTEPIGSALADPVSMVRRAAALALSIIDDPKVVPSLFQARADKDHEVRRIAYFALRKAGVLPPARKPCPKEAMYSFSLYAEYSQFYLGDSRFDGDTAAEDFWSKESFGRRLAICPPSLLGIATNRYDYVRVTLEVSKGPPDRGEDLRVWDHVVEASLEVPSGRVAIDGCLSYQPESSPLRRADDTVSPHVSVWPGSYRVRIYSGGLGTDEEERYRIVMWPAPLDEPVVLRDWTESR
jgi:hypothetical protein